MSHPHRFYAPFDEGEHATVSLPQEEAHHALRVARLKRGDSISVFNGRGLEVRGVLAPTGKRDALVEVRDHVRHSPPQVALVLALGGLHHDKLQQEVIRRAVETGFSRVCFWQADHSQKPVFSHDRWTRAAIESCKQCGRYYLPEIGTATSLEHFLDGHRGPGIIGIADAADDVSVRVPLTGDLAVVVGPEGDFSARERDIARSAGLAPVSLGDCIYRSETAASMLMTLVAHYLGGLGPPLAFDADPAVGAVQP